VTPITRRYFVARGGSCAAHLSLAALLAPTALRRRWAATPFGSVVAAEPFGRLEQIAPNTWALISTPLSGDYTTLSNGGIVAGRNAVLVIEGFAQAAGAKWLAGKAKELTGRWPTHVLITHYHGDHVNGVAGYRDAGETAEIRLTDTTRGLAKEKNQPPDDARMRALGDAVAIEAGSPSKFDLGGGRAVRIIPLVGHTASDVAVVIDEPRIVFAGDLLWNNMFPNYVDAAPGRLKQSVQSLKQKGEVIYVPGHGPVATAADFERYQALLDEIERGARSARERGLSAAGAAAQYSIPSSLGEWTLFNKRFIEGAFTAWYRELG